MTAAVLAAAIMLGVFIPYLHRQDKADRRLAESLARTRTDAVVIVIDTGAGSLLPHRPNRDIEATRRGLAAVRRTAAQHRADKEQP